MSYYRVLSIICTYCRKDKQLVSVVSNCNIVASRCHRYLQTQSTKVNHSFTLHSSYFTRPPQSELRWCKYQHTLNGRVHCTKRAFGKIRPPPPALRPGGKRKIRPFSGKKGGDLFSAPSPPFFREKGRRFHFPPSGKVKQNLPPPQKKKK